jgi:uncharacterized protein YbjQ (UPF0145 family)
MYLGSTLIKTVVGSVSRPLGKHALSTFLTKSPMRIISPFLGNGKSIRTTLTDTNAAGVQSGKGEVDVATIPILTTDSHPLGKIVKVHGVVSASSVRNKNILIDAYVAIKGIFGGSAPLYEDLVNEAYVSAANGLAEAAHQIGATHVIQVRFEKAVIITRFVIGTHCFVSAYGTAVDVVLDETLNNGTDSEKKA